MANLPETPQWEDGIYQIEVSDPVLGGPDGITNRPTKQLASRTSYLKQQVEKGGTDLASHISAPDPHTQYAPKASPTFTGTPTAPTPAVNDNSKKLVTTEFVARAIAALAGAAPETLNTLKELADAIGNDPNFATTILNKLAEKLAKNQNGSDIPDPVLFVKNLGLGTVAKKNVGTAVGQVPDMSSWTAGNGWRRTPDGIIEVWGLSGIVNTTTGIAVAVFPIPFPNECLDVKISEITNQAVGYTSVKSWGLSLDTISKTGFSGLLNTVGSSAGGELFSYRAIGR